LCITAQRRKELVLKTSSRNPSLTKQARGHLVTISISKNVETPEPSSHVNMVASQNYPSVRIQNKTKIAQSSKKEK
jgi:hypothetical protein